MNVQSWFAGAAAAAALGLAAPAFAQAPAQPSPAQPTYAASDWIKVDPQNLLVIDTTKGRIVVEMVPAFAPDHIERIKTLTRAGFYDGLQFFRVIDDFMAQTGDKANTGAGTPEYSMMKGAFSFRRGPETPFADARDAKGDTFGFVGPVPVKTQPDALMPLMADGKVKAAGTFCPGVAGMARAGDPDSASTQFFLMRQANTMLDDRYTPWGRVLVGLDVVRAIAPGEPPQNPDSMTKVQIAADMPEADRPDVWRVDPTSAAFRAAMTAAVSARGADFTPCDVEVPAEVRK